MRGRWKPATTRARRDGEKQFTDAGLAIVGASSRQLIYMDSKGKFRREEELSAEELIARFQKEQREEARKPKRR